ncbi:Crp/Fnr family transcriptional regulator [Pseudoruegeria sp. HB172150]|uniref:Crp/Fnr family transcriptional regulator n=1 Tax=Pseudoruegeria sp. HB172150 TaxID=2721164 RepID=UPI001C130D8D|nr:Crp/Fnr family transcriptional regulator [Pseudoruegeria sp. HB172150]
MVPRTEAEQLDLARAFARRQGWLAETPSHFADLWLSKSGLVRFDSGDEVCRLGEATDGIYGVVSGSVALALTQGATVRNPVTVHLPGSWFGETELLETSSARGFFFANRQCELLAVPRAEVLRMAEERPECWRWLGLLSVRQIRTGLETLEDIRRRNAAARIAATILSIGRVRWRGNMPEPSNEIVITQGELAALSVVSRASVVQLLNEFENAGLIKRLYGRIRLTDATNLRKIAAQR